MNYENIFQLFNALSSNDELLRNHAHQEIECLFLNPEFYSILFDILANQSFEHKYYLLATSCLLVWYLRTFSTIQAEKKNDFIQKLQSLLLVNHPDQKRLFDIYRRLQYISHTSDFTKSFLVYVDQLISVDTPFPILACALKVAWITSKTSSSTLNNEMHQFILEFFKQIQLKLELIISNFSIFQTTPIGCLVLRYCFKTYVYTMQRSPLSLNMIVLICNSLMSIVNNLPDLNNREAYLLVRYCRNVMQSLLTMKIDINIIQNIHEFHQSIVNLVLRFTETLAPLFFRDISRFVSTLFNHTSSIVITDEIIKMLIMISTLSENDMSDFDQNPAVFYEYAYSNTTNTENKRRICFDFMNYIGHSSSRILKFLLSQPPSEASMYLVSSIVRPAIGNEIECLVVNWVKQSFDFARNSAILLSTFLYLFSKVMRIWEDDELSDFVPIVFQAANSDFSLVVVTNAIRVARKMYLKNIKLPDELLHRIINLIPICPTSDAICAMQNYLKTSDNMTALNNLAQIESFIIMKTKSIASLEDQQFMFVANSLSALTTIVEHVGELAVTPELCEFIGIILMNFDEELSKDLANLLLPIMTSDMSVSVDIIQIMTKCFIESNHKIEFLRSIDDFFILYVIFMNKHQNMYFDTDFYQNIISFCIDAIINSTKTSCEEAAADLICHAIQMNPCIDVTPIIAFLDRERYKMRSINTINYILMTSIASRNAQFDADNILEIVNWVKGNNAKCPYELRLASLAMLKAARNEEMLKLAFDLLAKEKMLRSTNFFHNCNHMFPSPILQINIFEVAQDAAQKLCPEKKEMFLTSISQLLE